MARLVRCDLGERIIQQARSPSEASLLASHTVSHIQPVFRIFAPGQPSSL